ncbi:MAG TPA: phospholipase D-like domain-containing protein [Vineibacter sp.]|nr:phospholipase D-like domain-containing protein [Vineibacter sp.]
MAVDLTLIANCDDAVIFWRIKRRIEDCWGFAIEREKKLGDGTIQRIALDNRMGFKGDKPGRGERRPSTIWPFQRFWWADHSANLGDVVRYRVCPMVHKGGKLQELISDRSGWTSWTALSGGKKDGYASFFNRGLVISQFMARYLEDLRVKKKLATRKEALVVFRDSLDDHELPIRRFLSGALRERMLALLADAKKGGRHVFGALYELHDDELVGALGALGARAHVVLANGSITAKKGEPAAQARKRDQNQSARKALRKSGVEVFDRFISPGALGHNKFIVVADKNRKPMAVWTGSTNWTSTGLCTQVNNGLFVENRDIAREYLAQWNRLREAKSAFPDALVADNSEPKPAVKGKSEASIWFTRTRGKADLKAIDEVLDGAKEGILFLMFQPGGTATLGTVRRIQQKKKALYVKGVVSTLPAEATADESEVSVDIHGADKNSSVRLDVVQPAGIRTPFASWAATVARNEFIKMQGGVIGFAIVHSKLIVADPFTKPVVITGSHNFSKSASEKNDENFMIVRGNDELARHYAAHILSVYHHYRWLAYVNGLQGKGKSPDGFLREHDRWQDSQLKGPAKRELDFWLR